MTKLDRFLAYAESHRLTMCAISGCMIALIAWGDWVLPNISVGFLYLFPVLLSAAALSGTQIVGMAVLCGYLREAFDPLQGAAGAYGLPLRVVFNPLQWAPGATGRLLVVTAGF